MGAEAAGALRARMPQIDALKALASQLIVLHHLAFYGPMSDHASELLPRLFDWLADHARVAVQIFLVVAGYLAARHLGPGGRLRPGATIAALLVERYLRLVLPFAAMLVIAIAASALARAWIDHDVVPDPPGVAQSLTHLLLLHDLLGFDALSAGVWYVAIDFQLFALLLLVLAASAALERRFALRAALAPWIVFGLVTASLLHFNRDAAWDVAAPYFFGAYGLGVLAAWWGPPRPRRGVLLGLGALVVAALVVEFRTRVALALLVAAVLIGSAAWRESAPGAVGRWIDGLGRISYSVFLIHFPVFLVVNAFFTRFVPAAPMAQAAGVLLAWAASVAAGAVFHRHVEQPAMRWVGALRLRPSPA